VTNPLNTIITYFITLEGSEDFSVKQAKIKVEPKTSLELPIYFKGRISKPVSGRISLKPAKEAPVMVTPLVFDLKSKICGPVHPGPPGDQRRQPVRRQVQGAQDREPLQQRLRVPR
jgi:hypothetical protein